MRAPHSPELLYIVAATRVFIWGIARIAIMLEPGGIGGLGGAWRFL